MNPKHNSPDHLSQSDTDLAVHLVDLAETLEPDRLFQAQLEAELRQAHPCNSPRPLHNRANRIKVVVVLPRRHRRAALVAGIALAIASAFAIPTLTSGRATEWFSAMVNSTFDPKATALTIAQAIETGQITVTSDVQDYNETTQDVRAIGDAAFVYPEAQIQASADEIRYNHTARQVTLLGNVQISQRGETLRGTQATCSLEQKQCDLTQE